MRKVLPLERYRVSFLGRFIHWSRRGEIIEAILVVFLLAVIAALFFKVKNSEPPGSLMKFLDEKTSSSTGARMFTTPGGVFCSDNAFISSRRVWSCSPAQKLDFKSSVMRYNQTR